MRRLTYFFWVILGLAIVTIPIACGSSSNDDHPTDANPDSMTKT